MCSVLLIHAYLFAHCLFVYHYTTFEANRVSMLLPFLNSVYYNSFAWFADAKMIFTFKNFVF